LQDIQCAGDRGLPSKYVRTHATHAEYPQEEKGQIIGLLDDLLRVEQQTWQSLSVSVASACFLFFFVVADDDAEISVIGEAADDEDIVVVVGLVFTFQHEKENHFNFTKKRA